MGRIFIKIDENVETLVRLIVLKFHKNRIISKGSYSVQSQGNNSAQRETIMLRQTHPDLWAIGDPIDFLQGRSVHDGPEVLNAADCDTSDSDLLVTDKVCLHLRRN